MSSRPMSSAARDRRRRAVAGGVASLSAVAMLAGVGGVTLASWKDTTGVQGAQITTGDLDVEAIGGMAWTDATDTQSGAGKPVDLAEFHTSPADRLVGEQALDVVLRGDNLLGTFGVRALEASDGPALASQQGVSLTYEVFDSAGKVVVPSTPWGTDSAVVNLRPSADTARLDGVANYRVKVHADFDENTPDRVRVQTLTRLSNATAELRQVKSFARAALSVAPSVKITDPSGANVSAARMGDTITYSFAVTNTGSEKVDGVVVSDPVLAARGVKFDPVSVPANSTKTLTVQVKPKITDLTAGSLRTSSAAVGTTADGAPVKSAGVSTAVPMAAPMVILDMKQSYRFVKDLGTYGAADPGDQIEFTWVVKNVGGVDATDVKIDSSWVRNQYLSTTPSSVDVLRPGESATFTMVASPTIDDLVSENITNTALAYGVPGACASGAGCGSAVSNSQTTTIPAVLLKVLVADTFNRPNGVLGASSTGGVPWQQLSGTSAIDGALMRRTGTAASVAVVETKTADVDMQATFNKHNLYSPGNGFVLRAQDASNYLFVRIRGEYAELLRVVNGVQTQVGSAKVGNIADTQKGAYTMRVVAQGDAITCDVNGRTVFNLMNGNFLNATKHGLYLNDEPADDFYVTNTIRGSSAVTSDDFTRPADRIGLGTTPVGNSVWRTKRDITVMNGRASANWYTDANGNVMSWPAQAVAETLTRDVDLSADLIGRGADRGLVVKSDEGIDTYYYVFLGEDNNLYVNRYDKSWGVNLVKVPVPEVKDVRALRVTTRGTTGTVYLDGAQQATFDITINQASTLHGFYVGAVKKPVNPADPVAPMGFVDNFKATRLK